MSKKTQILISLDPELKKLAQQKCQYQFGIGLSPLIKIFLRSFITQKGVGFYIGDSDLCKLIDRWFTKKIFMKGRGKNSAPMPGPRLMDIYNLNASKNSDDDCSCRMCEEIGKLPKLYE